MCREGAHRSVGKRIGECLLCMRAGLERSLYCSTHCSLAHSVSLNLSLTPLASTGRQWRDSCIVVKEKNARLCFPARFLLVKPREGLVVMIVFVILIIYDSVLLF